MTSVPGSSPAIVHGVPQSYVHRAKQARVGRPVSIGAANLKWYEIALADAPVPEDCAAAARAFVTGDETGRAMALDDELGFVLLHRCGADFYFLLVSVWRGANEVWEAVYFRDSDDHRFRPFAPANPGPASPVRPTFCVWELGVVHHEAGAWTRYLVSARDEGAWQAWLEDTFAGVV